MKNIPLLLALALFSGCVNPYRSNFNSTRERYPNWLEARMAPPTEKPKLTMTDDIQTENWKMYQQGYLMVGFSKFDGPAVDVNLAIDGARSTGADRVLVQRKFSKTLMETVTVTQFPPSETTEVREDATISGHRGPRQVSRRIEVTTTKGPETVYVPKQVDYYEHSATYWRKIEKPVVGALVRDLSDEQKQKLQSNRGLMVQAVMTDSPAYRADLLKGDIILKLNGEPVPAARGFYEQLVQKAGKTVELTVLRGKDTFKRKLTLNP